MGIVLRVVLLVVIVIATRMGGAWLDDRAAAREAALTAVALNSGAQHAAQLRSVERTKDAMTVGVYALGVGAFLALVGSLRGKPRINYLNAQAKERM